GRARLHLHGGRDRYAHAHRRQPKPFSWGMKIPNSYAAKFVRCDDWKGIVAATKVVEIISIAYVMRNKVIAGRAMMDSAFLAMFRGRACSTGTRAPEKV